MTLKEMLERRANLVEENGKLLTRIAAEKDLARVKELETEYDKRDDEIVKLNEQIKPIQTGELRELKQSAHEAEQLKPLHERRSGREGSGGGAERTDAERGDLFRDLRTGEMVRVYRHGERLAPAGAASRRPAGSSLDIGHVALRCITGAWANAQIQEEARAMSVGSDSAGGYFVPEFMSREVIDLARAQSVVMRAGARMVPLEATTLDLARIESDPVWGWKAENSTGFGAADLTIGRVRLTARTVGTIIPLSEELWQDGQNIPEVLSSVITKSLAAEMDRVCLHGSGVGAEPAGIYVDANVNTRNLAAEPSNYDFVSLAVQDIRTDNHEPNAMVAHPRTYGQLDRLKESSTLAPLTPPRSFQALDHYPTTNVRINLEGGASPNDDSAVFVGKWDELLIGMRMQLSLLADRNGYDGTNNALTQYKVLLRAVMRMDVALMRPSAFCVVKKVEG